MSNRVRLLRDFQISLNGIRVEYWREGDVKTVSDDVLDILIGEGAVEIVEDKDLKPELETGAVVKTAPKRRTRKRGH